VADDLRYDVDGVPVIMDQETAKVIQSSGSVTIYSTTFGPRARWEKGCSAP
jgi:hypothetical protein